MDGHTSLASIQFFANAVNEFQNDLANNLKFLENAALVCSAKMKQDAVSQQHVAKLYEAIEGYDKVFTSIENVRSALAKYYNQVLTLMSH